MPLCHWGSPHAELTMIPMSEINYISHKWTSQSVNNQMCFLKTEYFRKSSKLAFCGDLFNPSLVTDITQTDWPFLSLEKAQKRNCEIFKQSWSQDHSLSWVKNVKLAF